MSIHIFGAHPLADRFPMLPADELERLAEDIAENGLQQPIVVDADGLTFSSMAQVSEDEPVCLLGLTVHILVAGATFNLHTRKASAGSLARSKSD